MPDERHQGKSTFVAGAAKGIGYYVAMGLGRCGASVMLADIDAGNLDIAARSLAGEGIDVGTVCCDVARAEAVDAAARQTINRFGVVHVIVNNAGVRVGGKTGSIPLHDWRWVVDVNLMGVVHGVEIFTPLIKAHGEGGHIVNTASMAGHCR